MSRISLFVILNKVALLVVAVKDLENASVMTRITGMAIVIKMIAMTSR